MVKKKAIVIAVLATVVALIILVGIVDVSSLVKSQVFGTSLTTDTISSTFSDREEKLNFLKKYLNLPSQVTLTEYNIVFQDNSKGFVPGPSDWDMRFAAKINREYINKWIEGFEESNSQTVNLNWWTELPLESPEWQRVSQPEFYTRTGQKVYLVVYKDEGIVLKRVATF